MTIHNPHVSRKPGGPGPVDRAAVNGFLTLKYPGVSDKLYHNSVAQIVMEFTSASGDVPTGAAASIALDASSSDYSIAGSPTRPFVVEVTPTKATATFYVNIPPTPADNLKFSVESATPSIVAFTKYISIPIKPDNATIVFTYADSDPLWLNTTSPLTAPFNNPPPHAIAHYTVTAKVGATPVENYLVEWQQVWDSGTFDPGILNVYGGNAASDELKVDYLDYSLNKRGVVRTNTNSSGLAEIYVAPTTKGLYYDLKSTTPFFNPHEFASVIVIGPPLPDIAQPYLNLLNNNLDTVEGDFVNVGVAVPSGAAVGDSLTYLLFVNGNLVALQVLNIDNPPIPQNFNIPVGKVAFKSLDDGSNGQNIITYAIASQRLGELTSLPYTVTLIGNKGQNTPQPGLDRQLTAPWINGAGQTVTRNTIADNADCRFSTVRNLQFWPSPAVGDVVTATLYANGWSEIDNTQPKNNPIPVTWGPLTQLDLGRGYAKTTVSKYLLLGYGPSASGQSGTLYFDGYVQVQGTGPKIYTKINQYFLST
jgi:hypothetical protein